MTIGIVKEKADENRVALTPAAVKLLIGLKTEVWLESGAGSGAFITDHDYENPGAKIKSRTEVLSASDCLLTIDALTEVEIASWGKDKILVGSLNPYGKKPLVDLLMANQITSFSLELLPRTTLAQSMDVLSSMATVSGYKAVLEAAFHMPRFFPMFMTAAGTIKPARVLILGAGVAGLQALATARRLGAVVEVFDVRSAVKDEVHSLGGKFIEVQGASEDAGAGGYAVEQQEAYLQRQAELIHNHAVKSDVIICTAQIPGKKAPVLLYQKTVEAMMPGSVVVDLAASTGGNCELTKNHERVTHHGVTIMGRSNYPSLTPGDASMMYGNNLLNFIRPLINAEGNIALNMEDEIVRTSCLTHNGEIVNDKIKAYYKTL